MKYTGPGMPEAKANISMKRPLVGNIIPSDAIHHGKRSRSKTVSWAAVELLEEVKIFQSTKPVNPSIPPPPDDALPIEEPSVSSPENKNWWGEVTFQSEASPLSLSSPPTSPAITDVDNIFGGSNDGQGKRSPRAGSGSGVYKGFQAVETVVRRRKLGTPPPPPPSPHQSESAPEGDVQAHHHRYPKDVWPRARHPGNTKDDNEVEDDGEVYSGEGRGNDAGGEREEEMEFFCDECDATVPSGEARFECAKCPDEYCVCRECYDEAEVLDKQHEHELVLSTSPLHITKMIEGASSNGEGGADPG
ncbi:unnamed protein product [Choristocarpus tenellus]